MSRPLLKPRCNDKARSASSYLSAALCMLARSSEAIVAGWLMPVASGAHRGLVKQTVSGRSA